MTNNNKKNGKKKYGVIMPGGVNGEGIAKKLRSMLTLEKTGEVCDSGEKYSDVYFNVFGEYPIHMDVRHFSFEKVRRGFFGKGVLNDMFELVHYDYDWYYDSAKKYFKREAKKKEKGLLNKKKESFMYDFGEKGLGSMGRYIFLHRSHSIMFVYDESNSSVNGFYYVHGGEDNDSVMRGIVQYLFENCGPTVYKEKETGQIDFLVRGNGNEFDLRSFDIALIGERNASREEFLEGYNEDFGIFYKRMLKTLGVQNGKGIALLHGVPGAGKTCVIRRLCQDLHDVKELIYIPNTMTEHIADPGLIGFLSGYPNRVLVIEDAETVLRKRSETNGLSSAVSNLLNMSDGIMSDILGYQIIATFNCEISNIDEAILRKGRLIGSYEFGYLASERLQNLLLKNSVSFEDILKYSSYGIDKGLEGWTLAEFYAALTAYKNKDLIEEN